MRRKKFGRILLLMVVLPMIAGMTGCKGEQEIAFRHLALNGRKAPGVVRIDNPAAFETCGKACSLPRAAGCRLGFGSRHRGVSGRKAYGRYTASSYERSHGLPPIMFKCKSMCANRGRTIL